MNLQLARATIAFEPVEQNVLIGAADPFQGLFDAPFGDRDPIIFQRRPPSFGLSVPIRRKLKKLRDLGCKKP